MKTSHAFTLIELLVVIAIIGILAAILFPVFARAKDKANQTASLSNVRQIGVGLLMYSIDSDSCLPIEPEVAPINGGTSTIKPYDMQLLPYIKSAGIFKSPSDSVSRNQEDVWDGMYQPAKQPRSYSISNQLMTQSSANSGVGNDPNTGILGRGESAIERPSETIGISEIWPVDSDGKCDNAMSAPNGSTLLGCDQWKLAGRDPNDRTQDFAPCASSFSPPNLPTRGYFGLGGYAFLDGHAAYLPYGQLQKNDWAIYKMSK